jgi:hypothetical protein
MVEKNGKDKYEKNGAPKMVFDGRLEGKELCVHLLQNYAAPATTVMHWCLFDSNDAFAKKP